MQFFLLMSISRFNVCAYVCLNVAITSDIEEIETESVSCWFVAVCLDRLPLYLLVP